MHLSKKLNKYNITNDENNNILYKFVVIMYCSL